MSIRQLFVDEGIIVPENARKPSPPCDVGRVDGPRVLELDDAGRAAAARIIANSRGADANANAATVRRLRGR